MQKQGSILNTICYKMWICTLHNLRYIARSA